MKRRAIKAVIILASVVFMSCYTGLKLRADEAGQVNFLTNVQESMVMTFNSDTYNFGNLLPGTPSRSTGGLTVSVRTNASNGYTLSIGDSKSGSNSALVHTDTTTHILDFSDGSIATPALWNDGTSVGLAFTVFAATTNKEAGWGAGTTYDDSDNKYAGIPQNATVFHTSAGYKTGLDDTMVGFILDTLADQKAGAYSGSATITATAVLS